MWTNQWENLSPLEKYNWGNGLISRGFTEIYEQVKLCGADACLPEEKIYHECDWSLRQGQRKQIEFGLKYATNGHGPELKKQARSHIRKIIHDRFSASDYRGTLEACQMVLEAAPGGRTEAYASRKLEDLRKMGCGLPQNC